MKLCSILSLISTVGFTFGSVQDDAVLSVGSANLVRETAILSVSIDELKNLKEYAALGDINAMVVTGLSTEYSNALNDVKKNGPGCFDSLPGLNKRVTDDGGERRTFAYDNESNGPDCLPEITAVEKAFDFVHQEFIKGLESVVDRSSLEWTNNDASVTNLADAPFKSHIHVYENSKRFDHQASLDGSTVPFHIDNGLYLLLTPSSVGLVIRNKKGDVVDLSDVSSDSMILLMGSAMSDWLFQHDNVVADQFAAVPHAVPSMPDDVHFRTVFARMRVAPFDAIPTASKQSETPTTFKDVFLNGGAKEKTLNRFLRDATEECGNSTHTMCWMSCNPIPTGCQGEADLACLNNTETQCKLSSINDTGVHGKGCELT
eukprot:Awhi_evm1s12258